MAPLLFRDMKGLSCSSQASTAICPSLERQPMVRSHKAIPGASPLSQLPKEPKAHRHDSKKGQQHKAAVVATSDGGLVSPAGSSRYLLSGRAAAAVTQEIQEMEAVPAVEAKREEASQAADANTPAQEQVRNIQLFTSAFVNHY